MNNALFRWKRKRKCCPSNYKTNPLKHRDLLKHICPSGLSHYCFRWWLVACSASSHFLNQYWSIVKTPPGTNLTAISIKIQQFAFNTIHLKMSYAKCQPLCLDPNMSNRSFVFSSHPRNVGLGNFNCCLGESYGTDAINSLTMRPTNQPTVFKLFCTSSLKSLRSKWSSCLKTNRM